MFFFPFLAQERLNSILKAMKDQHMRNQIKTEKKEELRSDDLTALRHDVSGLKFELLSYVKHVPKIVAKLNEGQTRVIEQIRVAHENHDRNSVKLHEQKLLMAEMHDEHTQVIFLRIIGHKICILINHINLINVVLNLTNFLNLSSFWQIF